MPLLLLLLLVSVFGLIYKIDVIGERRYGRLLFVFRFAARRLLLLVVWLLLGRRTSLEAEHCEVGFCALVRWFTCLFTWILGFRCECEYECECEREWMN